MNKKISIIMLLSCVGNIFSMGDDISKIYVSTADSAYSKAAALLAGASCTVGGFKLLELPASQNALATAASILESSKAKSFAIACQAGRATCIFLSKAGSNLAEVGRITFSKVSSISREAVEFMAEHPVATCVAGVAALGGAAYGIHRQATAAAEASRRQLELKEAETEAQIQEGLEMQEAWQDIRRALG